MGYAFCALRGPLAAGARLPGESMLRPVRGRGRSRQEARPPRWGREEGRSCSPPPGSLQRETGGSELWHGECSFIPGPVVSIFEDRAKIWRPVWILMFSEIPSKATITKIALAQKSASVKRTMFPQFSRGQVYDVIRAEIFFLNIRHCTILMPQASVGRGARVGGRSWHTQPQSAPRGQPTDNQPQAMAHSASPAW